MKDSKDNEEKTPVAILIEGGNDITITDNRIVGFDKAIVARGAQHLLLHNNNIFQSLYTSVPSLPKLDDVHIEELFHLARTSPSKNLADKIKHSRVGKWLLQQSFVDWANLAIALVALTGKQ